MPRLRETPIAIADKAFRANIAAFSASEGASPEDIAQRLRVSRATFHNRKNNPGSLRLDELRRLVKICKWDARVLCAIVGVEYK